MKILIAGEMNASQNEFIDKVNSTKKACNDLEKNLEKLWNNGQIAEHSEVQSKRIEITLQSASTLTSHANTIFHPTDFKDTKGFTKIASKIQLFCVNLMDTLHDFNRSLNDFDRSLNCLKKIKKYQEELTSLENSFPILHKTDHVVRVTMECVTSTVVEDKSITPL
uniref:Uncharacterized protein n=1 Tax=Caenorhabditis tropicalis TaxID=1561998 RepID=A0A1I7SZP1_9PELO